jgi:hypothetical protein
MNNQTLDFSFNMQGLDRQALLTQAAEQFDLLNHNLGANDVPLTGSPTESASGSLARALRDGDIAQFSASPTLYQITEKDFIESARVVPVKFEQLSRHYNFYWLYLPIALFPSRNRAFHRLEVAIEFNPREEDGHLRPTAYQILPQKQFQTLLEISDCLEIRLGENFEFSARAVIPEIQTQYAQGKADVSTDVKLKSGINTIVGPFNYHIKRAKIDHTQPGIERVFWRLEGTEFFQQDVPLLIVIIQVPAQVTELYITAAMQAYRYFNILANDDLKQAVQDLPKAIRDFFIGGIPLLDQKEWNLTPQLELYSKFCIPS